MDNILLSGDPPITVAVRQSARARRLTLRISGLDGQVTLTLPRGVSRAEGASFVERRADWLRKNLAKQPGTAIPAFGVLFPLEGQLHRIEPGKGRSVRVTDGAIVIPGANEQVPARLRAFLKTHARSRLDEAAQHYCARLGCDFDKLAIRDTRSRWGSCSSRGTLSFSWRVVMAPANVLHYLAAHEVAHLQEMNHSPDFWALVTKLFGPWEAERRWLRVEGPALHRWDFG